MLSGRQVTWATFDKEYTATPHAFLQPASREEVVSIVKDGARKVSAPHELSWSLLSCPSRAFIWRRVCVLPL
eukprot:56009-Eustigmatos_ZCMA.PRE.1